jgi:hypothetical protein
MYTYNKNKICVIELSTGHNDLLIWGMGYLFWPAVLRLGQNNHKTEKKWYKKPISKQKIIVK